MATFHDGDTEYILEWQGLLCVITLVPRIESVREIKIPDVLAPKVAAVLIPDIIAACQDLVLEVGALLRVWEEELAQVVGWTNVEVLRRKMKTAEEQLARLESVAGG